MYSKILLPTDGSEHSLKAARKAIEFQKVFGSKIIIYHAEKHYFVPEEPRYSSSFFDFMKVASLPRENQYLQFQEQFRIWGTQQLKKTEEIFKKAGIQVEIRLIMEETPEDYAKKVVKLEGIDLVIVGCKGHHSGIRKALIGTVAEKIANNVNCDVMIVR